MQTEGHQDPLTIGDAPISGTPAGSRRRAILSLDGGGIRGAITIAYLERLEALLTELNPGKEIRLCNVFDLIGGTSTGAIIATALALGFSASEVRDFYLSLAPKIFKRSRTRLVGFQTKFDAKHLEQALREIVGDMRLDDPRLKTGWAAVLKRIDTGSAWIVGNNPNSKWWEDPEDGSYIGNRHYRVAEVVRASAAAPLYFRPQEIQVCPNEKPGLFVDGGMTPHNNPSLLLTQWATLPEYGLAWPTGENALSVISIGTGVARPRYAKTRFTNLLSMQFAMRALAALISDAEESIVTQMQLLGRSASPWRVNSELASLGAGITWTPSPLFSYLRLNVRLEQEWLSSELGIKLSKGDISKRFKLDSANWIHLAYEVGLAAARRQIDYNVASSLSDTHFV